jgi:very-short-patch-repair endonuclease
MHLIHPEHPPANPGSLDPASPPSKTSGGLLSERRLVYFLSGAPTKGRFRLNAALPIAFDGFGTLEVDLLCEEARVAVELDGAQHLADPVAYRRDRRKDQLLQERGYFVLRFLAKDVSKELDAVLDAIVRSLSHRDRQPWIARVQAVGISRPGRP